MEISHSESTFRVQAGSGGRTLLAFSHRGAKSFSFFNLLAPIDQTKYFLRDSDDQWYADGVSGVSGGFDGLCRHLKRLSCDVTLNSVMALGASMGGYGAILVGALLGIGNVMALAPQTILNKRFPLSPVSESSYRFADLFPIVAAAQATKFEIVIGQNDMMDNYYAARLASLDNVKIYQIPGASHLVTQTLYQRGLLFDCIREWIDGGVSPVLQPAPHLSDPALFNALEELAYATYGGEINDGRRALGVIRAMVPEWPGAMLAAAILELKAGQPEQGMTILNRLAEIDSDWYEVHYQLGRAHFRSGDFDNAIKALNTCLKLNPYFSEASFELGIVYEMEGRFEDALIAFEKSKEIKPNWVEPKKKIQSILNKRAIILNANSACG